MRHYLANGSGELPPWYANMLHRREMGKKWQDFTGEPCEPRYVTQMDRWYLHWEWTIPRKAPRPSND